MPDGSGIVRAMAFNQVRINNLKPKDKRYTLSDDNLLILVEPSGSINYYTYIERKQIKLGSHPKLTLRQAVKLKNFLVSQHYMGTLEVTKQTFAEFVRGNTQFWIITPCAVADRETPRVPGTRNDVILKMTFRKRCTHVWAEVVDSVKTIN